MQRTGLVASTLLLTMVLVPVVRADDRCVLDEEKNAALAQSAALKKAEQSGQPAALFAAYLRVAANYCIERYDKNALQKSRANLPKLGRELAKAAEAKGLLYSGDPVREDGQTSAFRYYETIGDYQEANRVLLKAVQTKPDDLHLFETAWNIDRGRVGPMDPNTGSRQPYRSPSTFRQELIKVASGNADRLLKAEENDARGLSGSLIELSKSTEQSLEKLKSASRWMKYLPGGDKPARDRAELRGDTIMKRPDRTFSQMHAVRYYEFSGSPRAKEAAARIERTAEESDQAMEKAAERMNNAFTQKDEADQKLFEKKKAELEKELGF